MKKITLIKMLVGLIARICNKMFNKTRESNLIIEELSQPGIKKKFNKREVI